MIKIVHLTKIYKTKSKAPCVAIDGIDLVLPETGMVFILGKSGSGKSTLLNLIGGMDGFDGGDIVSFGSSLKSFSEAEFEAYRSGIVSFIFQDYHLLEELTVRENITLLCPEGYSEEMLEKTLERTDMREFAERYPAELSGGQRQRAAIARGIMKDPRVILCDEPTGNLDRKTSVQILDLLKEISREKLVVIVSHNLTEAQSYADRIIELADGKIVDDASLTEGYEDRLTVSGGEARLPYRSKISEVELLRLNSLLKEGKISEIKINGSGFEPTEIEYREQRLPIAPRPLARRSLFGLFKRFFRAGWVSAVAAIVLSSLLFGIFSIVQSFTAFDAASVMAGDGDEPLTVVIERDFTGFPLNIYDIPDFAKGEDCYPLYSQTIWLDNPYDSSWDSGVRLSDENNFSDLYIHETYGLLLCDEEYLLSTFGIDGEIRLLAGDLSGARGQGLLITDYFADSIIRHELMNGKANYLTYDSILGTFNPVGYNAAADIAGIIDTGYEEKYQPVMDLYSELMSSEELTAEQVLKTIREDELYIRFIDDVTLNLGIAYSLNPDYVEGFDLQSTSLVKSHRLYFSAGGAAICNSGLNFISSRDLKESPGNTLAEGEIGIPYDMYNELFSANYKLSDVNALGAVPEQTVSVRRYKDDDVKKEIVYERIFTVKYVTAGQVVACEEDMLYFKKGDWQPSRIYVTDPASIPEILEFMDENGYHFVSMEQNNLKSINSIITTFRELFLLLEAAIIAITVLFLCSFGLRSIKKNSYQIGVIKALGGRSRDIGLIFVLKTFIVGLISAAVSAALSWAFISFANGMLLASIKRYSPITPDALVIIDFIPGFIAADAAAMIAIAFISALIPAVCLRRIKPIDIIKAKE